MILILFENNRGVGIAVHENDPEIKAANAELTKTMKKTQRNAIATQARRAGTMKMRTSRPFSSLSL